MQIRLFNIALFALLVFGGLIQVRADSADDWAKMRKITPKGYVCYRASKAPKIDGKLDEPEWQLVPATDKFVDIEGDRKPSPRFATRVKMMWDNEYFYIGADMEEPHVWGTLTKHDSVIFHDNDFEVFIDPNGDNHEYYEFEMNALNTGWDLFLPKPYKDKGKADNSWEIPGLRTAVAIDGTLNDPSDVDNSWSVEIAIPWKVLKVKAHKPAPPRHGDQWRVNFSRVEWKHQIVGGKYQKVPQTREDNWVWSPQGIIDMHRPERWGFVQFSTDPPGKTQFRTHPSFKQREVLMGVYHQQKGFHQRNQRWANGFEELGVPAPKGVRLKKSKDGFIATMGKMRIRHDSLLIDISTAR